ncbi:MAG: choice-of-anchor J domain-containing protein, partial [candidate division WOR-3 bacterium]
MKEKLFLIVSICIIFSNLTAEIKDAGIVNITFDNVEAPVYFDTIQVNVQNTGFREIAVGKNFKGPLDDTVRIFAVMPNSPCLALLINDTTKFPPLKPREAGWQRHGNNGRWIDSSLVGFHSAAVGDINNDGVTDMLYARGTSSGSPYRLFRAWWNGTSWQKETLSTFVGPINEIAIGDADNDGYQDIVFPAGNAIFRMKWTGSGWQRDSIYGGDGSACHAIAIGDVDLSSARPGKEIYIATINEKLIQIYYSGGIWISQQIDVFTSYGNVDFYDMAIGDFMSDVPGNEIVINNGYNYQTWGHFFIYYYSNDIWWRLRLNFQSLPWGQFGEITIGNIYDLHNGNEIIAVGNDNNNLNNIYPVTIWQEVTADDTFWRGRYLPRLGGTVFGIAVGNVNKHRPPAGIPVTDEIVFATGTSKAIYECEQRLMFNNDIVLDSMYLLPTLATTDDSITVKIKITNLGYKTQDTIPVFYRVWDSISKFDYAVLETCFTNLPYNLGTYYEFRNKFLCNVPSVLMVKCSVALANEQYSADDFLVKSKRIYGLLGGLYTVGSGGYFNRLTEALTAWNNSVIISDVTFRLVDESYTTNEIFPLVCSLPVAYRNGDWQLKIEPANITMPTIQGSNPTTIFDLKSIKKLIIDSLIIINNSTGSAIRFISGASNNQIRKCILRSTNINTGTVFFASSSSGGNNGNSISDCIIAPSGTGFPTTAIYFNGGSSPNDNCHDSIIRCTIYDFKENGIWLAGNSNFTVIAENEIYSSSALSQQNILTMRGIIISSSTVGGTKILRNKIRDFKSVYPTPTFYGIQLSGGSTTIKTTIANNFISLDGSFTHVGATIYGISEASGAANRFDIFYNSIYIGGNNLTANYNSYGLHRGYPSPSIMNVKNNIIFNNRSQISGNGKHYAIYCADIASGFISDYNDLYVTMPGNNGQFIGYWNGICTTLANWQSASLQDYHSISLNPNFQNAVDLHINSNSINVDRKGIGIADIVNDIDNQPRHPTHPDIGADEYTPNPPSTFTLISPDSNATWVRLNGQLVWHKANLAEYYDVYLDTLFPPSRKVSSLTTDTVYSYSRLKQTKTYFWQVVALNDTNPNDENKGQTASNIWCFTTVTLPLMPSNLRLTAITDNTTKLTWQDNSFDEAGFYIRCDTNPNGEFPIIDSVSANETTYTAINLIPNTHYYWQVSAYNFWGETDPIMEDSITLAETPQLPSISNVSYLSMKIYLSVGSNPPSTKFLVRVIDETKSVRYLHPSGVLSNDTVWATFSEFGGVNGTVAIGLLPNTIYRVDVKARNEDNIETNFGPSVIQTTLSPLTLPFGESFENTEFPPFGWQQKVIITGGTNWSRVLSGSNPTQTPYHGLAQAQYNSYNAPQNGHARLITPPISLGSIPQAKLIFYMYHNTAASNNNDSLVVEVSTDFGNNWQRIEKFNRYYPSNGWQRHIITLNDYVDSIILIAFHGYSAHGNNIFIDSVAVVPWADIMVSQISRPQAIERKRVVFQPQITILNNSGTSCSLMVNAEIWTKPQGYYEGFETTVFPPIGWTVYNNDGGGEHWKRSTVAPYVGLASAICASESPGLRNDDWLITPLITVPENGELRFWYRTDGAGNDSLEVLLATGGNAISNFTELLDAFGVQNTNYNERVISLVEYVGQNVYIAFVSKGLNAGTLYLDEIALNYSAPSLVYTDYDTLLVPADNRSELEIYFDVCQLMNEGKYLFKTEITSLNSLMDLNLRNRSWMNKDFEVLPVPLTLIYPLNNLAINDSTPLFSWESVPAVSQYRLQVASDSLFSSIIFDELTNQTNWQVPEDDYLIDGRYFWRVKATLPLPEDPFSEVWSFTIDTEEPQVPELIAPSDSIITNTLPPFIWHRVSDAVMYNFILRSVSQELRNILTNDTILTLDTVLAEGPYYWKVSARDLAGNWSGFCQERVIIIDLTPPQVPIQIQPANNAVITSRTVNFVWHSTFDSTVKTNEKSKEKSSNTNPSVMMNNGRQIAYNLVITNIKDTILYDTSYTILLGRGNYSWKVRAKDIAGNWSDFSSVWTFTVQLDWVSRAGMPSLVPGKYVKDGGALVSVNDSVIYAFRGNKSNEFYQYSISR